LVRAAPVLIVAALFSLFWLFCPTPLERQNESYFIYSNPLLSKAALGFLSPIAADFAWLGSVRIGEMSGAEDKEKTKAAFTTIASLDPSFFHAINYGATYLAAVQKDKEAAYSVIDRALSLRPNEFRLIYLKLLIEASSDAPDKNMLKELAAKAFLHKEFKGFFGARDKDEFLLDILLFANDKKAKKEELKKELLWLLKNTNDKRKKELIMQKITEG